MTLTRNDVRVRKYYEDIEEELPELSFLYAIYLIH